jgi:hypothetical protein
MEVLRTNERVLKKSEVKVPSFVRRTSMKDRMGEGCAV